MTTTAPFNSAAGLPEELVPLFADHTLVCEYASIKHDGTPITAPLVPYRGANGHTIDVATGLSYPLKAERARKNPKVCLLYAEPKAMLIDNPPVILIYGHAAVHDANLQANLDRFVREQQARSQTFAKTPPFLLRWLSGYFARIWISVTPLKIFWWPEGDIGKPPQEWRAPAGTHAPPSDPPPKPLSTPHKPVVTLSTEWREDLEYAVQQIGPPTLTVVDKEGYPVPFRVLKASLHADGVHLVVPANMPAEPKGRACLNFYSLHVENNEMVANETISFTGNVLESDDDVLFKIKRQLPNLSIKRGLRGMIATISEMRRMGKRAEVEAARRGQAAPTLRL